MKKIPPFKLVAEPLDEEAKKLSGFKWAGTDSEGNVVGTRHKLGGSPQYIQQNEIPKCPDCREEMTFYGQLDSINDDYCLADCGIIYVFVCFDCFETKSIIQSY
ncbi:hypothetical protein ACFL2A_03275 [Thermodesulfobacteriota bacterium]